MQCIYDMFEGLGKRPTGDPKERAGAIFRKIDINGDGDLTENEFIKGCSEDKVEIQCNCSNYPKIYLRKLLMDLLRFIFKFVRKFIQKFILRK